MDTEWECYLQGSHRYSAGQSESESVSSRQRLRDQILADVLALIEAERLADWAPVVASPVRR
jgi:hypothetical protein